LEPDLNGQEFVGTAEYMSPEAVAGKVTGIETDLWALGIVAYQLLSGYSTFHSPSPYLAFLRIKRCNVRLLSTAIIPTGVAQLISNLVIKDRTLRLENALGSPLPLRDDLKSVPVSRIPVGPVTHKEIKPHKSVRGLLPLDYSRINYDKLRKLAYLTTSTSTVATNHDNNKCSNPDPSVVDCEYIQTLAVRPAERVPMLKELCIRAVGKAGVDVASIIAVNGGRKPAIPWVQVTLRHTITLYRINLWGDLVPLNFFNILLFINFIILFFL